MMFAIFFGWNGWKNGCLLVIKSTLVFMSEERDHAADVWSSGGEAETNEKWNLQMDLPVTNSLNRNQ
jgi:hypothetical protein